MPSQALHIWRTTAAAALDQIGAAHAAVGGTGPGRRFATEQVNHAYAVLLSSQFQRFCRDLHTEAAHCLAGAVAPSLQQVVRLQLLLNRQLDRGNPNPGNLGADFGRLGMAFWHLLANRDGRNGRRQADLKLLNRWRNAIAHQDFDPARLASGTLRLSHVRRWRRACDRLAADMDLVVGDHLRNILGVASW